MKKTAVMQEIKRFQPFSIIEQHTSKKERYVTHEPSVADEKRVNEMIKLISIAFNFMEIFMQANLVNIIFISVCLAAFRLIL